MAPCNISSNVSELVKFRGHIHFRSHLFKNFLVNRLNKAKVADLELALVVDEDVLELDIEMGNTGVLMQGTDSLANLHKHEFEQLLVIHWSVLNNKVK